jgi:hypothetical protein
MEKRRDEMTSWAGLVFSLGWLPWRSSAPNPPIQEEKPAQSLPFLLPRKVKPLAHQKQNKFSFFFSHSFICLGRNALQFHFILNLFSHSQRENKWNERN